MEFIVPVQIVKRHQLVGGIPDACTETLTLSVCDLQSAQARCVMHAKTINCNRRSEVQQHCALHGEEAGLREQDTENVPS